MKILIAGSHGMVGSAVTRHLTESGNQSAASQLPRCLCTKAPSTHLCIGDGLLPIIR